MSLRDLPDVLAGVDPLARRFAGAGHRLYLVGGVVRDLLCDRDLHGDIDLTTDARPDVVRGIVAPIADHLWTQGERFGTIGCEIEGRSYEITTHRAEAYDPGSRKPDVAFGDDVVTDLSRRDFTVNAMAWEVPDGQLVDPHGGREDLEAGVLATPLEPSESFADDPLRMVRAARFVASLDLRPAPGVEDAMTRLAPRLDIVAVERIREELEDKLLATPGAARGLEVLVRTGLLARILPELTDPAAAARALDRVARLRPDPLLRLAGLLAEMDATALARRLAALRCSNADTRAVSALVAAAATVGAGPPGDDAAVRRLAAAAPGASIDDVFDLAATVAPDPVVGRWRAAHARLAAAEDPADLAGPLAGTDVIDLLGVAPGPVVGEALAEQRRLRTRNGPMTADEVRAELRRWWDRRTAP